MAVGVRYSGVGEFLLLPSGFAMLLNDLIRFAHENESLRPHLLPLIREAADKAAHGPVAIRTPDVMLYMIDQAKNNSKFYEMAVVPAGRETSAKKEKVYTGRGWVLMRRWGRLTDSGGTGRVDSINDYFHDEQQARRMMLNIMTEKTRKGYTDASRQREYPIGLGGAGFGWGGQAACRIIPELMDLNEFVGAALGAMSKARREVGAVAREDSSMAKKLQGMIVKTVGDLEDMQKYLEGQLAQCR